MATPLSRCPTRGQISGSGEISRRSCAQGHPLPSNTHLPHPEVWERPSGPPSSERPSLNTRDSCLGSHLSAGQSKPATERQGAQESLLSAGSQSLGFRFAFLLFSESVLNKAGTQTKTHRNFGWESL